MRGYKTVTFNIAGPIFLWLAQDYGISISPEFQEIANLAFLAVGNLVLRVWFTDTPVFNKPKKTRRSK